MLTNKLAVATTVATCERICMTLIAQNANSDKVVNATNNTSDL